MRVTMTLTNPDIENVDVITGSFPGVRNKTHAVSTALAFLRFFIDSIRSRPGTQIFLRDPDGSFQRVVMPGLETIVPAGTAAPVALGAEQDASAVERSVLEALAP